MLDENQVPTPELDDNCLREIASHLSPHDLLSFRATSRRFRKIGNAIYTPFQCLQTLQGHTGDVNCLAVLPNGRVVSGSYDYTLKVWDSNTGQCLQTWQEHTSTVYCLAILPNGRMVSGSVDNTLKIWVS